MGGSEKRLGRLFGGARRASLGALVGWVDEEPDGADKRSAGEPAQGDVADREVGPFLQAAVEHAERYGSLAKQARGYRLLFVGQTAASLLLAAGILWAASELQDTKVVPYIVEVDAHGYAVPLGPMERAGEADPRVVLSALSRWVVAMRTVTGHRATQQTHVDDAFRYVAPKTEGARKMFEWYEESRPFDAGARSTRVEVQRVASLGVEGSYALEWVERSPLAERDGEETRLYSAAVQVAIQPSQKLSVFLRNPGGVYVQDFSISQLK